MKKIKYSKLGLESFSLKELQRICRYYGIEYFPSWSKAKLREEILAYSPAETIKKTYTIPETYEYSYPENNPVVVSNKPAKSVRIQRIENRKEK